MSGVPLSLSTCAAAAITWHPQDSPRAGRKVSDQLHVGIRKQGRGLSPGLVRQIWPRLIVHGASGTICLQGNGNPYKMVIDFMQFAGSKTQAFQQVAWPGVTPPGSAATFRAEGGCGWSGDEHQRGWRSGPTSRVATRGA